MREHYGNVSLAPPLRANFMKGAMTCCLSVRACGSKFESGGLVHKMELIPIPPIFVGSINNKHILHDAPYAKNLPLAPCSRVFK